MTYGNAIDELFVVGKQGAEWKDSTGAGKAVTPEPAMYVAQEGSPWSLGLYARALLADDDQLLAALPGGRLKLTEMERLSFNGEGGRVDAIAYALSGTGLAPSYFLLDGSGALFAAIESRVVTIRKGYAGEATRLRELAAKYSTERLVAMQAKAAHDYGKPVRITNVRVFDPLSLALTEPKSVVVYRNRIAAVLPADSPATPGEVLIDGEGGTLVPGLYDMHVHLEPDGAMLNVLAGVTSMRDMGNNNAELDSLIQRIDKGVLAGPRITRSGMIEGKSPYSANSGIVVASEAEAIDTVRFYAARGFPAIKTYNSIHPDWVAPLAAEAKSLGLRIMGHVPAFTNPDALIAAGYDEMTHINQLMLGWVLEPGEDTRTLLRLTALKRLPAVDLNSPQVQKTINAMVAGEIAIDPSFARHEETLLSRNGTIQAGVADYFDQLALEQQRIAKQGVAAIDGPEDDKAYAAAFDKITETLKMMHDRGIFIIVGTDFDGSFALHRDLELYTRVGFTPAQILRRASYDMAEYLHQDQSLGSIAKGKLADFFLVPGDPTKDIKAIKTIRMVVKDGVFYYPSEVYPEFGIKPFVDAPKVTLPKG